MAKFSEETLNGWTIPLSNTEDHKITNAEQLVKEAIKDYWKFRNKSIEMFKQGSYANNTNVRLNSDIDINVHYTDAFYFKLPEGKKREDYGLNQSVEYSYLEYKIDVEYALISKFGRDNVVRKNKCITVLGNTNRVKVDVVPTWIHRWYLADGKCDVGVVLFSDTGNEVVNYPKQHIQNGISKNDSTYRRYKKMVRIFKKVRLKMKEEQYYNDENITSFLIECLVWNCPNSIFIHDTWNTRIKEAILHIYQSTENETPCQNWNEVSNLLRLFHSSRKWDIPKVRNYMIKMWNYMEY